MGPRDLDAIQRFPFMSTVSRIIVKERRVQDSCLLKRRLTFMFSRQYPTSPQSKTWCQINIFWTHVSQQSENTTTHLNTSLTENVLPIHKILCIKCARMCPKVLNKGLRLPLIPREYFPVGHHVCCGAINRCFQASRAHRFLITIDGLESRFVINRQMQVHTDAKQEPEVKGPHNTDAVCIPRNRQTPLV